MDLSADMSDRVWWEGVKKCRDGRDGRDNLNDRTDPVGAQLYFQFLFRLVRETSSHMNLEHALENTTFGISS